MSRCQSTEEPVAWIYKMFMYTKKKVQIMQFKKRPRGSSWTIEWRSAYQNPVNANPERRSTTLKFSMAEKAQEFAKDEKQNQEIFLYYIAKSELFYFDVLNKNVLDGEFCDSFTLFVLFCWLYLFREWKTSVG